MKKTCDNCATCPVMKIDEKLRILYDWCYNFPHFEGCGKLFNGKTENVLCFSAGLAKTINWDEVKKVYEKNKEKYDKRLEEIKNKRKGE